MVGYISYFMEGWFEVPQRFVIVQILQFGMWVCVDEITQMVQIIIKILSRLKMETFLSVSLSHFDMFYTHAVYNLCE